MTETDTPQHTVVVPASVLDEDKDGTDEVFVRARFVDGDCGQRVQNTNVVKGDF